MAVTETNVEKLRKKRQQWINRLDGDDANSITNQLQQLTWDITVFRVLRERPLLSPGDVRKETQTNSVMVSLFDRLFATSVLMALRRLVDAHPFDGNRGVNSLVSLIGDIRDNACLLRRDVILELGPVDDVHRAYQGNNDFLKDWKQSKSQMLERLIKPGDQIPAKRIQKWEKRLEKNFKPVRDSVNKTIAHAATPKSREGHESEQLTYGKLYDYHKELCQTAVFLQHLLTDTDSSFLEVPSSDLWKGLSMPVIAEEAIPNLEQCWQELAKEYENWGNDLMLLVPKTTSRLSTTA